MNRLALANMVLVVAVGLMVAGVVLLAGVAVGLIAAGAGLALLAFGFGGDA